MNRDYISGKFINRAYIPFSVPKICIKCFSYIADKNNLNKFKNDKVKKAKT